MSRAFLLVLAMLAPIPANAQLALPVSVPSAALNGTSSELLYTIALDGLPNRPVLRIEVVPDAGHADIELEIELTNFVPLPPAAPTNDCPTAFEPSFFSDPSTGPARLHVDLYKCYPGVGFWNATRADVVIRALDFGSGSGSAQLAVEIDGITRVPTGTIVEQVAGPQTVTLQPLRDTVIYDADPNARNGRGQFLWSGTKVVPHYAGGLRFIQHPLHSLIAFPLDPALPPNAVVSAVQLDLFALGLMGSGGSVGVFGLVRPPFGLWWEGGVDAPGDEFSGDSSVSDSGATWLDRGSTGDPWTTPGGDVTSASALASQDVTTSGAVAFSSPALTAEVQSMVTQGSNEGFLLAGPDAAFLSSAVQFASDQHADAQIRPEMTVSFSPAAPYADGYIEPGLIDFIDEGDDFRWIYDLDRDDVFVTDVGGVCEVLNTSVLFTLPYTYTYQGDPDFVGVDCCTWRVDSLESQTTGAGQALFYHNLDPTDPANDVPDLDGDGIKDLCDNCAYQPNGPALGSCVSGTTVAGTCLSDLDCTGNATCQLAQQDANGDFVGDACPVPEPGIAAGLAVGIGLIVMRGRTS